MKKWIQLNSRYIIGAIAGALAGFVYWKYIGCVNGTCAITSNPYRSIVFFGIFGAILAGTFKKENKDENANISQKL